MWRIVCSYVVHAGGRANRALLSAWQAAPDPSHCEGRVQTGVVYYGWSLRLTRGYLCLLTAHDQVGVRVVMAPGKRWQGVGSINRVHENGTTCAVKWDSGRLDRSLLINDLIVKKATGGSTPSKPVSDAPATPASTPTPSHAQTPSSPDKSYTPTAASAPKPAISAASPAKVTAEAVENTSKFEFI